MTNEALRASSCALALTLSGLPAIADDGPGSIVQIAPANLASQQELAGDFPYEDLEEITKDVLDILQLNKTLTIGADVDAPFSESSIVLCKEDDPTETGDLILISPGTILSSANRDPDDYAAMVSPRPLGEYIGSLFHELGHLCTFQTGALDCGEPGHSDLDREMAAENYAAQKMCEATGAICSRLAQIESDLENEEDEEKKEDLEDEKERLNKAARAMCLEIADIVEGNSGELWLEVACVGRALGEPGQEAGENCPGYELPEVPDNEPDQEGNYGDGSLENNNPCDFPNDDPDNPTPTIQPCDHCDDEDKPCPPEGVLGEGEDEDAVQEIPGGGRLLPDDRIGSGVFTPAITTAVSIGLTQAPDQTREVRYYARETDPVTGQRYEYVRPMATGYDVLQVFSRTSHDVYSLGRAPSGMLLVERFRLPRETGAPELFRYAADPDSQVQIPHQASLARIIGAGSYIPPAERPQERPSRSIVWIGASSVLEQPSLFAVDPDGRFAVVWDAAHARLVQLFLGGSRENVVLVDNAGIAKPYSIEFRHRGSLGRSVLVTGGVFSTWTRLIVSDVENDSVFDTTVTYDSVSYEQGSLIDGWEQPFRDVR